MHVLPYLSPNSTWLVTSPLDTTAHVRRVALVVSSVSSRAVRQSRHSRNAWARHVERVILCRVETWRDEPSGIWALWRKKRIMFFAASCCPRQIECLNLTSRQRSSHEAMFANPVGIAVFQGRLYVSDAARETISSVDLQLSFERVILRNVRHPRVLRVYSHSGAGKQAENTITSL